MKWFWEIVENHYSQEMRLRLLQFVTGSSRVPLQGFKALQGNYSQENEKWLRANVLATILTWKTRVLKPSHVAQSLWSV